MKLHRTIFLGLLIALPCFAQMGQHATYRLVLDKENGVVVYLNDATFTPGAIRTTDTKAVCSEGTKQFRHTGPMKAQAYREYGETKVKGKCCEVDHLVPLELGGADELLNLWPQPYPQAYWKDAVEDWAHKEVCAGRRNLTEMQHAIAENWYIVYQEMNSGPPKPTEKDEKQDKPTSAGLGKLTVLQADRASHRECNSHQGPICAPSLVQSTFRSP